MALLGNGNRVDSKDPWATAKSGYSPSKFYTRSTNGHDHSETLHIKVSPALYAAIMEAVDKVPEYRSKADVVRDSLLHRLHAIDEMLDNDEISMGPIDVEARQAEIDQMRSNMAGWQVLIEDLDATLTDLIRERDWETAAYLIEQNAVVTSMTPPFQRRLGDVLDRHRRTLSQQAPDVD